MGTAVCWFILTHAIMSRAVHHKSNNILTGQTYPDDPNPCFWFYGQNGNSVFRCCNGTQKYDRRNITERCTECQDGYYGNNCEHKCTCQHDGICNKANGSCSCINNYFGNTCQYSCNCENGGICLPDGSCICSNMFYGELCQHSCECPVDRKCHGKTEECICQDGYYDSCHDKCSGNSTHDPLNENRSSNPSDGYKITSCLPCNCSDNGQCDPFTGHCTCNPGYHGEYCDEQCSCYNGAVCSDADSYCRCTYGWKGPNCTDCDLERDAQSEQLFCGEKCLHCYNGDTCRVGNGDCRCTPGWQGNRCDSKCDKDSYGYNCSQQCKCNLGLCDHVNGSCKCDDGWRGHHCDHHCPEHCITCTDKICLSCHPGRTGVHCDRTCKDYYYGDGCKQACPPCNCTNTCNNTDGSCLDVVSCHEHNCDCKNGVRCFENTSHCECQDGWSGPTCDVETITVTEEGTSEDGHDMIPILVPVVIVTGVVAFVVLITVVTYVIVLRLKGRQERIHNERYKVGDDSALCLDQATLPRALTSDGNSVCCMSELHSRETDRNDGSGSQTTAGEENGVHSLRLIFQEKFKKLNSADGKKSVFEGPYSIVPIEELLDSDSDSDTESRTYNILDRLGYKKEQRRKERGNKLCHSHYEGINRNSDTNEHDYELLRDTYKFDSRKAL